MKKRDINHDEENINGKPDEPYGYSDSYGCTMQTIEGHDQDKDYMECRSFHLDMGFAWTASFRGDCGTIIKRMLFF